MSAPDDRRFARLSRLRQAGMLRFVLLWGVVAWGLPVGAVWFAVMSLYARYFWGEPPGFSMWNWLPFTLAIFSAAGAVGGVGMWPLILWLHARALKARSGDAAARAQKSDLP